MDRIRGNIEHYKIWLRSEFREGVLRPDFGRNSGKTQALIELAHEQIHSGMRVAILAGTPNLSLTVRDRYIRTFGEEENMPIFAGQESDLKGKIVDDIFDDRPEWSK